MRKGQMEMIGLVFVVVLIVVGIILYVSLSERNSSDGIVRTAKDVQTYTSFLTALAETDVPECGIPVSRVAAACLERDRNLCDGDPCRALNDTIQLIAAATLKEQGLRYNLSLDQTSIQAYDRCNASAINAYAPSIPIVTPGGIPGKITLTICR